MLPFDRGMDALIVLLCLSLLLAFIRLYAGPGAPNRTVAFDLIAIHAVGIIVLVAVRTRATALLDGAIITAVLGFLGTLMLARFLEESKGDDVNGR